MERPKLLLADDSVTIRKVVELTFADEGIDVTAVADADTAMQSFVETEPDIVLVDATLAGTSGYRICEMIKADDATRHIPVLLLVGSFERFDDEEAVRVGADGFMTKPFQSIRELVTKVRDLLDAGPAAAPVEADGMSEPPPVPVFGEEFSEPPHAPESAALDTAEAEPGVDDDIDHLYRESFGMEGQKPEPASKDEEYLGDVGMDDDMIEASYKAPSNDPVEEEPFSIPLAAEYDPDKKFDWSPDAVVVDPEPPEAAEFEPRFVFADDDTANNTDESETAADTTHALEEMAFNGDETLEMDRDSFAISGAQESGGEDEDAEILDLDLDLELASPLDTDERGMREPEEDPRPSIQFESSDPEPRTSENGPAPEPDSQPGADDEPDPAIHETIPYDVGEQPPIREPGTPAADPDQFPAELVDQIVQKVIERLSDNVVREVARIEVPRIAEKLIREALDGSKRN